MEIKSQKTYLIVSEDFSRFDILNLQKSQEAPLYILKKFRLFIFLNGQEYLITNSPNDLLQKKQLGLVHNFGKSIPSLEPEIIKNKLEKNFSFKPSKKYLIFILSGAITVVFYSLFGFSRTKKDFYIFPNHMQVVEVIDHSTELIRTHPSLNDAFNKEVYNKNELTRLLNRCLKISKKKVEKL